MGVCFSSVRDTPPPTAKVVSVNGDLSEYPVPVVVSQILIDSDSFFVCNSDCLYYDQMIPKLEMDHQLQPNHIYFLLPLSWLERPLSPSNMAHLAAKATLALHNSSSSNRRNKSRISPALFPDHSMISAVDDHESTTHDYYYDITIGSGSSSMKMKTMAPASSSFSANISRTTSVKKLRRFTSSRAKMAVRSFRLTLTTIYEGTAL
ncbi:hypothetical protein FNV43_RR12138 [Rhamnella rubrinervis]|uniref:Uncharacterized protein n=1 Tax=Rhamnella rubrinervis TaxID=2594499 RepID=A0A8K0H7D8_9ROSA|nr:hypothetical protein FNV43_RR12138 [Rhamnella rubrinervis]